MSETFEIVYAAHTASCTFLLDAEGICRSIVPVLPASKAGMRRDATRSAARCVGAQYVASLDANVAGMLAELPRVGAPMLFARTDERGRISLVRTGSVTRFETHHHDPFTKNEHESVSLHTSAPFIAPSTPAPRLVREAERAPIAEVDSVEVDLSEVEAPVPPARNSELRPRMRTDSDSLGTATAEYEAPARTSWPEVTAPMRVTMAPPRPFDRAVREDVVPTLARAPRREMLPPPMPPKVAGRR